MIITVYVIILYYYYLKSIKIATVIIFYDYVIPYRQSYIGTLRNTLNRLSYIRYLYNSFERMQFIFGYFHKIYLNKLFHIDKE